MTARKSTARARQMAWKREVVAEIKRLQALAAQRLAEFDDSLASRLRRLKAEMAAAHPDHGGSNEAFIAARERYLGAKRTAGVRRPT